METRDSRVQGPKDRSQKLSRMLGLRFRVLGFRARNLETPFFGHFFRTLGHVCVRQRKSR